MKTNFKKIARKLIVLALYVTFLAHSVYSISNTYAWFNDVESNSIDEIRSATYGVAVAVYNSSEELTNGNGVYYLSEGNEYEIALTVFGSAKSGYVIINLFNDSSSDVYVAKDISPLSESNTLKFKIIANKSVYLSVEANWGECNKELKEVKNNEVIIFENLL